MKPNANTRMKDGQQDYDSATDLNNFAGTDTPQQGAAEAIRLALLADDGPTGTTSSSTGSMPCLGLAGARHHKP